MSSTQKIWNLLVSSGLVPSSNVAEIRTQCEGEFESTREIGPDDVLKWLHDQKKISGYQLKLLAEGQPGPFQFEKYRIHARVSGGPMDGSFRAMHMVSNHPVRLCFFGGSSSEDAQTWQQVRKLAESARRVLCPFVARCFDVVEDGDYRFVVFEDQPGKLLSEKQPYKARLPWPQSLQCIELLALGLAAIHSEGLAHGRIWPGSVWLQRGGICQLIWQIPKLDFDPNQPVELSKIPLAFQAPAARNTELSRTAIATMQREDLFSLGALAFRMVSGKPPKIRSVDPQTRKTEIEKHLEYCEKYDLPDNVTQLIRLLLTADISSDLKDAEVTAKLAGTILESQSIKTDIDPAPATLTSYEQILGQKDRSQGFLDTLESIGNSQFTEIAEPDRNTEPDFSNLATNKSQVSVTEQLAKRKNRKKDRLPLIIGGSILAVALVMGAVLGGVFSPEDDTVASSTKTTNKNDNGTLSMAPPDNPEADPAIIEEVSFRPQSLVDDDGEMPWESPTGARPIDVSLMPAAPEFLLAMRPRRIGENQQATQFIRSFGPRFTELSEQFTRQTNIESVEIERLNISLHGGAIGRYEFVVVSELVTPLSQEELWQRMGKPIVSEDAELGLTMFTLGSNLVYFESSQDKTVSRFGLGSNEFLKESLDAMGPAMAGRTIARLIERSDRDRDFTLMFRNAALLSEEGKWLFGGDYSGFRRPLSLFFDDRMEGVKLSLHFDQGSYLEWMSVQTPDMNDGELIEWLPEKFASVRDELTGYVSQIPPHPYWARVQQRFDNMLNEIVKQLRVGRESSGVVANCWLPEVAPHNLFAASELVMNGNSFATGNVTVYEGPANLQELLETPRDLSVASDPDLINLLREIELEIRDDYPELPFEFRIRVLGNDLLLEGITQNQRPGNFDAKQTKLGEILAQIMLRANSDKSATSPADEKCKLVWVIGPDPADPDTQAVLVTTRNAVADRDMSLPDLFVVKTEDQSP